MTKTIIIETSSGKINLTREEFDGMVKEVQSEKWDVQQFQFPSSFPNGKACSRGIVGCIVMHSNAYGDCEYEATK